MFRSLRLSGIILIAGLMTTGPEAIAESNPNSANSIMPGCRTADGNFQSGLCMGLISGLAVKGGSCPPSGVTDGQKRLVIVAYIDARPARLQEDFRILALEAMKAAWPCKR